MPRNSRAQASSEKLGLSPRIRGSSSQGSFSPLRGWNEIIPLRIDYSHLTVDEGNSENSEIAGVFRKIGLFLCDEGSTEEMVH